MATATESTPTGPLPVPAAAALSRLEAAFAPAVAEQFRIERTATQLQAGGSAVINGTPVTAVSLPVAEAITRYRAASKRTAVISGLLADPSYARSGLEWDDLAHARDVMAGSRDVLVEAGMLHLLPTADEGGAS